MKSPADRALGTRQYENESITSAEKRLGQEVRELIGLFFNPKKRS